MLINICRESTCLPQSLLSYCRIRRNQVHNKLTRAIPCCRCTAAATVTATALAVPSHHSFAISSQVTNSVWSLPALCMRMAHWMMGSTTLQMTGPPGTVARSGGGVRVLKGCKVPSSRGCSARGCGKEGGDSSGTSLSSPHLISGQTSSSM